MQGTAGSSVKAIVLLFQEAAVTIIGLLQCAGAGIAWICQKTKTMLSKAC